MGYKDDPTLDKCGGSCFDSSLIQAMEAFNRANGFTHVSFLSRSGPDGQEVVNLTAVWLPPASDHESAEASRRKPAPRIVVQHGRSSNINDCAASLGAYQLRALGFGVLMPNLRDHGTSGRSSHSNAISWGWDYQYDLLGAWDYAVNDPDGLLGGALSSDQVGIQGYSMAGHFGPIAFGLEKRIPAAWFDSGLVDVYEMYSQLLQSYLRFALLEFLTPVFQIPGWYFTKWTAGVDIEYQTPEKALASSCSRDSRDSRPVAIVASEYDVLVPYQQSQKLVNLLSAHGNCYDVTEVYFPKANCNNNAHVIAELAYPSVYQRKLCRFWNHAFKRNTSSCGELPSDGKGSEPGPDLTLTRAIPYIRVLCFLVYLSLAIVAYRWSTGKCRES
eukprot:TRINITY_DN72426_c0_g1_i1.p1 TRINITY_DN72426_c0_g1~~TRINITY_DN72426_c0_g1_i1.p1  ORF type:complete len:446 (-),score=11.84 TRINITY_DN72426_c0_g1_i1:2-1162(-)